MPKPPIYVDYCAKDMSAILSHLSTEEIGAFYIIFNLLLITDNKLRDDDTLLAHITRTGRGWKKIRSVLFGGQAPLFSSSTGHVNSHLTIDLVTQKDAWKMQKKQAGKNSANFRKALKILKTRSTGVDAPLATEGSTQRSTQMPTEGSTYNTSKKETSLLKSSLLSTTLTEPSRPSARVKGKINVDEDTPNSDSIEPASTEEPSHEPIPEKQYPDEVLDIVDRFHEIRRNLWPAESGFPAPELTLRSQAASWLEQGIPVAFAKEHMAEVAGRLIERKLSAPRDLRFCGKSLIGAHKWRANSPEAKAASLLSSNPIKSIPNYVPGSHENIPWHFSRGMIADEWGNTTPLSARSWSMTVRVAQVTGFWDSIKYGPAPGLKGCVVPISVIRESLPEIAKQIDAEAGADA